MTFLCNISELTDASGNTITDSYEVWVPHNQVWAFVAVNDGPDARYTIFT